MSSISETLQLLEDKLQDLQRDTKFCVNNYGYHHKNNEHEILRSLHDILKDSQKDGQEFIDHVQNVRTSIDTARKKCSEIDELLIGLGVSKEMPGTADWPGSRSFSEEQEINVSDENKENDV